MAVTYQRPTIFAGSLAPLGAAALAALALVALTRTEWGPLLHHAHHAGATAPALSAAAWMVGWSLMAVAMMLPAATPLIVRTTGARGFLTLGVLGVWTAAGLAALVMALSSGWAGLSAGPLLLIAAGVYQLSPAKARALTRCRAHARRPAAAGADPTGDALRAGVHHGVLSLGCCGPLMVAASLASPGGVGGMLALGALLAAEQGAPGGSRLRIPLGLAVIAVGAGLIVTG
jgi:predicted metal-binding membrane protein